MTPITTILAQSGIGDTSEWALLWMFCLWPFHISSALSGQSSPQLVGYGAAAVTLQVVGLVVLCAVFPFVLRSRSRHRLATIFYLPVGYPLVLFATNIGPALIFR